MGLFEERGVGKGDGRSSPGRPSLNVLLVVELGSRVADGNVVDAVVDEEGFRKGGGWSQTAVADEGRMRERRNVRRVVMGVTSCPPCWLETPVNCR